MAAPKVLLIGWDSADWKIINPLLEQGQMPALQSLIENGSMGNITTLNPPLSPLLWTSIATGKLADKHGVLGFYEPNASETGVQPVTNQSRKTKAIWNILNQQGFKTNVVGWWPSHPAEPVDGIMLSNSYYVIPETPDEPLMPGTVYPEKYTDLFAHLRVHPTELSYSHILPFVPKVAEIDTSKDSRLNVLLRIIAEAATVQSASTWMMDNSPWDFMGIYFHALDIFGHNFMHLHPPQLNGVSDSDFDFYHEVMSSAYRFHDMMLETLIKKAGPDTTIILLSDHGFHNDHLRQTFFTNFHSNPEQQHREQGILIIKGPGIKKDELIHGASLLNITPTILQLFGLPAGSDMDGIPLVQVFDKTPEIKTIESWDTQGSTAGILSSQTLSGEADSMEVLKQLVNLGYIEDPGEDNFKAVQESKNHINYNLARVFMGSGRYAPAIPLLENLNTQKPDNGHWAIALARSYMETGQYTASMATLDSFSDSNSKLENIQDEIKAQQVYWNIQILASKAELYLRQNKNRDALDIFKDLFNKNPNSVVLLEKIGNTYLQIGNYEESRKYYEFLLKKNPESEQAYLGLALCCLYKGEFEDAANYALDATGLNFRNPLAHYHLAVALDNLGQWTQAAEALTICLKIMPDFGKARHLLIDVYQRLGLNEKAEEHILYFNKPEDKPESNPKAITQPGFYQTLKSDPKNPVIIVSGLPRSGTSAMMQVLAAGGMPVFTDNLRNADESNPRGYFEHEAVKNLAKNSNWVGEASGKVVKVIAQLVPHLPPRYSYKIIFMERSLDEIIASQHKMLIRNGKMKADTYPGGLRLAFQKQVVAIKDWISKQYNIEVLYIQYIDLLNNPNETASKVCTFTGKSLNIENMVRSVDISLYREKI